MNRELKKSMKTLLRVSSRKKTSDNPRISNLAFGSKVRGLDEDCRRKSIHLQKQLASSSQECVPENENHVQDLSRTKSNKYEPEDEKFFSDSFLKHYEENQSLTRIQDQKFPDLCKPQRTQLNSKFASTEAAERYSAMSLKKFIEMRIFPVNNLMFFCVNQLIECISLTATVTEIDSYVEEIVREFYANFLDRETKDYGTKMVFVRGSLCLQGHKTSL